MPERSYAIWFSQRVGSTLLARSLAATGVAGNAGEWLTGANVDDVLAKHGASGAVELRDAIWRAGTTPNGVLGIKYGQTGPHHAALLELMARVPGAAEGAAAWAAFFPECRHVFMTRRNKVRLAASWWRAIKTGQWHRERGEAPTAALVDAYDFDAITHLIADATLREAAHQAVFEAWGIVPLTVVYEDFIARYDDTVRGVLAYLGVGDEVEVEPPPLSPTADDVTEAWVQRYREERQRDWEPKIW